MKSNIYELRRHYELDVEAPFTLIVGSDSHRFQCLIKGYGARLGMIIDKDWDKIEPVASKLVELGYGYSCFDIEKSCSGEDFQEILDDWGKTHP